MGSTDDDERAAALVALHGRYGVPLEVFPASPLLSVLPAAVQRRLRSLLSVLVPATGLVVALGAVVWAFAADGGSLTRQVLTGGGLTGVPWEALLVLAAGCAVLRWGRSAQTRTVVDADAVAVTSGRRERRVGWDEVSGVEPARRFETWPTAVLTDGTRLELPGVPPEV
ncbi:PH domain-containing protein, partial [Streptomyces sp. NP160]|uniref:PH domain-containing protein n=1 Tax=Streptomyces sp. NP160 TaxID=2586637 RepID=UPI001C567CC6